MFYLTDTCHFFFKGLDMVRLGYCLVPITASLCLSAGQPTQPWSKSWYWPWEVQLGGSWIEYGSHASTGLDGTTDFSPKGIRLAPLFRFSLDPIVHRYGSLVFTAAYRFGSDVPLEYRLDDWQDSKAELKHRGQLMLGSLIKFDTFRYFGFGIGFEGRQDWMKASGHAGAGSQDKIWRPWVRATVTYKFEMGTHSTPFIGIELAHALSKYRVRPGNHYRDYAVNTGDFPLGDFEGLPSPTESFTRGHFPSWEASLVGGIRFGRHGRPDRTSVKPLLVPQANINVIQSELVSPDGAKTQPVAEAPVPLTREARLMREGFQPLVVHFEVGVGTLSDHSKASIDRWVEEAWNDAEYSKILHVSQLRIIANADQLNELSVHQLSGDRANALAQYLWDKFRINISKLQRQGSDRPMAIDQAEHGDRYAILLLDESDPRNSGYRNNNTPAM